MAKLNAGNNSQTLLDGAITDTDTSMTVLDGSIFPDTPFAVTIEDEIIYVVAKSGNIFSSLLRGQEGTAAAAHAKGVSVENRMTAGMYNALATQEEVDEHKAETASINAIGHVYAAEFTATLSTSWSGSAAPYTQTVTINGITSAHNPIIDVVMSGTYSTDQQRIEQWGYIYRAVTGTNQITFYASEKPTVSLPIRVKVVE